MNGLQKLKNELDQQSQDGAPAAAPVSPLADAPTRERVWPLRWTLLAVALFSVGVWLLLFGAAPLLFPAPT